MTTTLFQILQEEWTCPINKTEIRDPVMTVDGHTYERTAIEHWLKSSHKSPKTGANLTSKRLVPNLALKSLREKILDSLPKEFQLSHFLRTENEALKQEVTQLKEELEHVKQFTKEEHEIHSRIKKQGNMQSKLLESKKALIQKYRNCITRLQNEINELKSKQFNHKTEYTNICHEYESKINTFQSQKKKALKKQKSSIRNIREAYEEVLLQQQTNINRYLQITCVMIWQISKYEKETKDQNVKKCINQIFKRFRAQFEQIEVTSHDHTHCAVFFEIYEYLVRVIEIQPKDVQSIGLVPRAYVEEKKEFSGLFNVITVDLLKKLMKKWGNKRNRNRLQLKLIDEIEGISDIVDEEDWRNAIASLKVLNNLQVLTFYTSRVRRIKKQDLQKFTQLAYVDLRENVFQGTSLQEIKEYQRENPDVIVMLEGDRSERSDGQDMEDAEDSILGSSSQSLRNSRITRGGLMEFMPIHLEEEESGEIEGQSEE